MYCIGHVRELWRKALDGSLEAFLIRKVGDSIAGLFLFDSAPGRWRVHCSHVVSAEFQI